VTRVIVEGKTASEWLRLTVDPRSRHVFRWERRQQPPQLTVATFNIAHGGQSDLERVAQEIERGGARIARPYGTAILAGHPILWSRNSRLPRPENGEQRGLLEAGIEVDGVQLRVATLPELSASGRDPDRGRGGVRTDVPIEV
jgi:hypothetical protein